MLAVLRSGSAPGPAPAPASDQSVVFSDSDVTFAMTTKDRHWRLHADEQGVVAVRALPFAGNGIDAALPSIVAAFRTAGAAGVSELASDFSLIAWSRHARILESVRDPVGLRPLYYCETPDAMMVADTLASLLIPRKLNLEFVAAFLATLRPPSRSTVWEGVSQVPAGASAVWRQGQLVIQHYWRPATFLADRDGLRELTLKDAARDFRGLLRQSLVANVEPEGRTWAHLSGGLDSSMVVSFCSYFNQTEGEATALGGAVSFADSMGNADETHFSDAVAARYGLRNPKLWNYWPWRSDGVDPPMSDAPARDIPFYARERAARSLVETHGGDSILSGCGPDDYFPLTAIGAADAIRSARIRESFDLLLNWSVHTRIPVWESASQFVISPIFRRSSEMNRLPPTPWLGTGFRQAYGFDDHLRREFVATRFEGSFYDGLIERGLKRLACEMPHWTRLAGIDLRHPLLDRRLVEYCLRLPGGLKTDLTNPKPLLRCAGAGVVPDVIRRRKTFSSIGDRMRWAFRSERRGLAALMTDGELARRRVIDPHALLQAMDQCVSSGEVFPGTLLAALSLETWLATLSGRHSSLRQYWSNKGAQHEPK